MRGGGTGREYPKNLLTKTNKGEGWNKWYETSSKKSYVKINVDDDIEVRGFGFMSANDVP